MIKFNNYKKNMWLPTSDSNIVVSSGNVNARLNNIYAIRVENIRQVRLWKFRKSVCKFRKH